MSITIYLADDHTIIREGLRLILSMNANFSVVGEAGDGRTALKDVVRLKPDIAIMDIAMPELNGIEATELISKQSPGTKVIILSMYSDPEHIYQALKAGAKGFVLKDSAGTDVSEAIMAVNDGQRFFCRKIGDTLIDDYIKKRIDSDSADPMSLLSSRERQTLQLVAEGKTSTEIAVILDVSPKSVDTYRSRLMQKLGIDNLPALIKFAIKHHLVDLD